MSRPIFITWAPPGNYPAGGNPWNGQPIRVVPGYTYSTPDTLLPAEYLNYLLGSLADAATWLGTIQLRNLGAYGGSYNGTPENYAKPVFDATNQWWLAGGPTGGNGFQFSKDYGRTWALAAAAVDTTPRVHAIYADSTGWYSVGTGAVGNLRRSKSTDKGATWAKGDVDAAWTPVKKVHDLLFFSSLFIVIGDDGTHTRIYTSNTTYTTWTHITNPAAINTVTTDWHASQSPTRWVALSGLGGGIASVYCTTTDGVVFTAGSVTGPAASWIAKGICYNSVLGLFFAAGDDTTDTKIYSSSDGSTWTLVATITGTIAGDIGASGSGMVFVQASTGQNPNTYFSVDGATWTITPIQLASDTTPFMPVRVLASDNQMGVANGTSLNLSLALG